MSTDQREDDSCQALFPRTSPVIINNIPDASSPTTMLKVKIQNDPVSSQKRVYENEEQDNEKMQKKKGSTIRIDIESDDQKVKYSSPSKLTSRLCGDEKGLMRDIDETEEQGANLKDSSFKQKIDENDAATMISKTEFLEVINETIEDESTALKNCSDDRIDVE